MKRHYLMDTGIAQDYQARRRGVREAVKARRSTGARVGICVPVLGELWSGVECSDSRERNLAALLEALTTLFICPFTTVAAEEYGRIFAELKRVGRRIQQVDMQVAAIVHSLPNCVVVTKDSDLKAISGIVVENWAF